jgi:hypothetical protein
MSESLYERPVTKDEISGYVVTFITLTRGTRLSLGCVTFDSKIWPPGEGR